MLCFIGVQALHDGHEWMELLLRRAHAHLDTISECVITGINCHAHVEISLKIKLIYLLLSCMVPEEVMTCCRRFVIHARIALKVLLLLAK